MNTPAGSARLTEIDSHSEWGPIRLLQLITIRDGTAYILTGAALKEEFSQFSQEFKKAFHSLNIASDLLEAIPQAERRASIKKILEGENKDWKLFQNFILHDFDDMERPDAPKTTEQ